MRAAIITAFGGPEVMRIGDWPEPKIGPGDVLVEVMAASVNPIDAKFRQGALQAFFKQQPPHVMGRDFAGRVAAVGAEVTDLSPGDLAFGCCDIARPGSHAERVAVDRRMLLPAPPGWSAMELAALGIAGLSALALVEAAGVAAGQQVLVHAGAGGVGSLAIQLAKARGAAVAATCGKTNVEYVRSLGADLVIDYRKQDFTQVINDFDAVLDVMGGAIHRASHAVLRQGGVIAWLVAAPIEADPARPDVQVRQALVKPNQANLTALRDLLLAGAVRPQVSEVMTLDQAAAAYERVHTGHGRGKLVLRT